MILRRLFASSRIVRDIAPGDFVRRVGMPRVGLVESVNGDHATVAWNRDCRDILPLGFLRRIPAKGHDLDRRDA